MTEEALARHRESRVRLVDHLISIADQLKVCDQCYSISYLDTGCCPICRGYRFHHSPEAVRLVARIMATNPWPRTAGVPPRLATDTPSPVFSLAEPANLPLATRQPLAPSSAADSVDETETNA